ncbi:glycosyl hydrolase 108 family protein [Pseudomonas sp.]|uniref:glycosyl hydrolase 108 family protein n=1 Tax=Pseudomonas sp. TaxID=306 RepID=UPI003D13832F
MSDVFAQALSFTLQREGKTSTDPDDPGNWTGGKVGAGELKGTRYGISAAAFPNVDIRGLTLEDASLLYRVHYWMNPKFDQVAAVAPDVAARLFDLGVNCGTGGAGRMLQRALNVVAAGEVAPQRRAAWRQKIVRVLGGKVLRVDGAIGPVTLEVLHACPYQVAVLIALIGEAYNHYRRLDPLYIPGWLERLGS